MECLHTRSDTAGLVELEERVRQDRQDLCQPAANWVPSRSCNGQKVVDIVVVGAGMCGLVAHHALIAGGMRNILHIDRSPEGREGPWVTFARMNTLRSPKNLTGPAFGHAALTFRAWFRAQYGEARWEALDKIDRPMWMEYLRWYRKVLDLPIQNGLELQRVTPEDGLLRVDLGGQAAPVLARKLVLATGRDGTGQPIVPRAFIGLSRQYWAHTAHDIDFAKLSGKRVAVIGVGSSAMDNAAEALEAGAAEVRLLARRSEMPTINKLMGIGSQGFTQGYKMLPDEWRWRMMRYSFVTQTPPPRSSTLRVSRHQNAAFHFGQTVEVARHSNDVVHLHLAGGASLETDFVILATGFTTDPMDRQELGAAAADIQLWQDVYTPPADEKHDGLGRFPYLNGDFSFRHRVKGQASWLSSVYCFNYGAAASLGKVSGDIPGISEGAALLANAIAATLYAEDICRHWQEMQDYSHPELAGDEWSATGLPSHVQRNINGSAVTETEPRHA